MKCLGLVKIFLNKDNYPKVWWEGSILSQIEKGEKNNVK